MSEENQLGILKENMIFQKTHTSSLLDVRALNMWGYNLEDVSIIEKMPNLETISLSLNHISTLKHFSNCLNLKSLFLRQNQIKSLSEIDYLARLPNLRSLMLKDNPISNLPNYRTYVARILPFLEKLDDIDLFENKEPIKIQKNLIEEKNNFKNCEENNFKNNKISSQTDERMLTAVLALIPELSQDSLEIILETIKNRIQ